MYSCRRHYLNVFFVTTLTFFRFVLFLPCTSLSLLSTSPGEFWSANELTLSPGSCHLRYPLPTHTHTHTHTQTHRDYLKGEKKNSLNPTQLADVSLFVFLLAEEKTCKANPPTNAPVHTWSHSMCYEMSHLIAHAVLRRTEKHTHSHKHARPKE